MSPLVQVIAEMAGGFGLEAGKVVVAGIRLIAPVVVMFVFAILYIPQQRKFKMFNYPVTLTPDNNGTLHVSFADVPEAVTSAVNEDEALLRAIDALETGLSFYIETRRPLPRPGKPGKEQKTVCPSALACAKLGVYQTMMNRGMKKTDLARRLGWYIPQVDRLFNLKHSSRFDHVEAAARVLGKRVRVKVV